MKSCHFLLLQLSLDRTIHPIPIRTEGKKTVSTPRDNRNSIDTRDKPTNQHSQHFKIQHNAINININKYTQTTKKKENGGI
ncbi:hypothetical protein F5H01DRAFT_328180, partial [Linnemannia elongata]